MKMSIWLATLLVSLLVVTSVYAVGVEEARRDYGQKIDLYRSHYSDFLVKRELFERAGTFAAQEDLTRAAREMLIARGQAWQTYFRLQAQTVATHPEINAEDKELTEATLNRYRIFLDEHINSLEQLATRSELLGEAEALHAFSEEYQKTAYGTLMRIRIAHLRAAIREIERLTQRLEEAARLQIKDSLQQESRLRGFDEISTILITAQAEISTQETQWLSYGDSLTNQSGFSQLSQQLQPAYSQITRAQTLLRELSIGLEL
jgi:hypothetical protein